MFHFTCAQQGYHLSDACFVELRLAWKHQAYCMAYAGFACFYRKRERGSHGILHIIFPLLLIGSEVSILLKCRAYSNKPCPRRLEEQRLLVTEACEAELGTTISTVQPHPHGQQKRPLQTDFYISEVFSGNSSSKVETFDLNHKQELLPSDN
jgi:hypothetical protein